jgi:acetolactate synthase-1/2/3 large subunit
MLAEACGAKGIRVTQRDQVEQAVLDAQAHPGTCVVEFVVEQEDAVYPMVPAGADLGDMIRRDKPEKHNPIYETGKDD